MKNKLIIRVLLYFILVAFQTVNLNAQDWLKLGNPGTNPATDFVGTTDFQPLNISTNNGMAAGGAQPIYFKSNGILEMTLDAFGNLDLALPTKGYQIGAN